MGQEGRGDISLPAPQLLIFNYKCKVHKPQLKLRLQENLFTRKLAITLPLYVCATTCVCVCGSGCVFAAHSQAIKQQSSPAQLGSCSGGQLTSSLCLPLPLPLPLSLPQQQPRYALLHGLRRRRRRRRRRGALFMMYASLCSIC